jgi:hypothetical protein
MHIYTNFYSLEFQSFQRFSVTTKEIKHFSPLFGIKNLSLLMLCANEALLLIQMDIGGHPPFPTGSKQLSDIFGNLLFLVVFTSGAILRA